MCPSFPFSARACLNRHHWLANRMRADGMAFCPYTRAFLTCSDSQRLDEPGDSAAAHALWCRGETWPAVPTPFFTAKGQSHRTMVLFG
jgi:hypothetical protein